MKRLHILIYSLLFACHRPEAASFFTLLAQQFLEERRSMMSSIWAREYSVGIAQYAYG